MFKVGEFIYPWGNGHYSRMMRLNKALRARLDVEIHFSSKSPVYDRLIRELPEEKDNIHEILMPTPIDGKLGPSLSRSMLNILLPVSNSPPLVRQISDYLKEERKLYDRERFDLVINDGDVGSNILARNRGIPSLFITNQFMPKLWKSRSYLYPSLVFVARQIAKAKKILVADSAPPYTMCEYNLNFPKKILEKVEFVGHFTDVGKAIRREKTDFEKLIKDAEFGYWMRTGNKSTNDGTGERYEQVFCHDTMKNKRRVISHARHDDSINSVTDRNGRKFSMAEAYEKKTDWVQIDIGYLSDQERDSVLEQCSYAVVNGSHTAMGEILGVNSKPIIGMPIYDEHTNQIKWAEEKNLGILANNTKEVLAGIDKINAERETFSEALEDFSRNFCSGGAETAAKIAAEMLEGKR